MAVALSETGPFSVDKHTLTTSTASNRVFTLVNAKFNPNLPETVEVLVTKSTGGAIKLKGDGTSIVAGSGDEFYVNSATDPSTLTIEANSVLNSITDSTITSLSSGDLLVIRRISNRTTKNVDYAPGSVIREIDLDNSNTQILHVAQEAVDIASSSMVLGADDEWDGKSKVIKNVANGVNANDATNVGQFNTHDAAIEQQKVTTLAYQEDTEDYKLETADWATKVNGVVNTYTDNSANSDGSEYSAKAYSVGGTGVTGGSTRGSAKDWAVGAGGTMASKPDGSEYSAKEYAQGSTATGGTSKQWSLGGGSHAIGTAVAGTDYASKAYAQSTTAGTSTYGGSAKGWASTAYDAAVPGAGSSDRSALHYATDVSNKFTSFRNDYLGDYANDTAANAASGVTVAVGSLYFNTTTSKLKVCTDASGTPAWSNATSAVEGVATITELTPNGSDTHFAFSHDVGLQIVWLNGVRLIQGTDYLSVNSNSSTSNMTSGTASHIYLSSAPSNGDVLSAMGFGTVTSTAVVPKSGGAFTGAISGTDLTLSGDLTVSGTTTTVDTTLTVSDAMVVNNGGSDVGLKINSTSSGNIMQLQDSGSDVLVVADGGVTTGTFAGPLTGNVTGNASGTAATVTGAAQSAITSVGTLTALTGGTGDFNWDSNTLVVDSSESKVGIGTAAPLVGLSTAVAFAKTDTTQRNAVLFASNEAANPAGLSIRLTGHASAQTSRNASLQTVEYGVASSGNLSLQDSGGSVGIGTTDTQGAKLAIKSAAYGGSGPHASADEFTIEGSGDSGMTIFSGTSSVGRIRFGDSGDNAVGNIKYDHSSNSLGLGANGGDSHLVINTSGNVGITGTLTIGADDTGHDVVFYGATSGKKMQWDESLDTLSLHSSILENSVSGSYRLHPDANTVGTCTYAFKDDNDTGMIRTGANAMGLVTGGTARLNIDSSGNVGIGTSVPAGRLHVHSTSGDGSLKISGDNIATSGGVLVGHSGGLLLQIAPSGGGTPVERVRFNHDGKVGIGVTPAAGALEVLEADDGDPGIRLYKSSNTNDSNQIFMEFVRGGNANGRIVGGGAAAVAFASWSDERLKENITDITGQLDLINKLRPVTFDWKSNGESSVGFIAQEFINILPEKVSTDQPTEEQIEAGETGTMAIAQWSSTDARIVAAIQELSAKVTALENA